MQTQALLPLQPLSVANVPKLILEAFALVHVGTSISAAIFALTCYQHLLPEDQRVPTSISP